MDNSTFFRSFGIFAFLFVIFWVFAKTLGAIFRIVFAIGGLFIAVVIAATPFELIFDPFS